MLKRDPFVASAEHEEAIDGHEAGGLDVTIVGQTTLDLLEVTLEEAALRCRDVKSQRASLREGDDVIDGVWIHSENEMSLSKSLQVLDEGVSVPEVHDVCPDVLPRAREVASHRKI